jgi:hypothetical protein
MTVSLKSIVSGQTTECSQVRRAYLLEQPYNAVYYFNALVFINVHVYIFVVSMNAWEIVLSFVNPNAEAAFLFSDTRLMEARCDDPSWYIDIAIPRQHHLRRSSSVLAHSGFGLSTMTFGNLS